MKAAIVTSPGIVEIAEVDEPVFGDYDVLCKVLSASICSGTDKHIVGGDPYHKVEFPAILGHEGIGQVISCGRKVKYLKVGDVITRVSNRLPENSEYQIKYGAFAEKAIATDWQAMREDGVEKKEWNKYTVHRVLPKDFDPLEATMIITWRETLAYLKRMQVQEKDIIVIVGSGAGALAFAHHARNLGLQAYVIGSPKRKNVFLEAGVKFYFSYLDENNYEKLVELGIKSADIILDALGKAGGIDSLLPLLKDDGKIGVYGLEDFFDYKINIADTQGDFKYYCGNKYDEGSAHDEVMDFIKEKKLNAWDYLSKEHIYPFEKINEALQAAWSGEVIKSVIKFN